MPCPYRSIFRKVIESAILNRTVLDRLSPRSGYRVLRWLPGMDCSDLVAIALTQPKRKHATMRVILRLTASVVRGSIARSQG